MSKRLWELPHPEYRETHLRQFLTVLFMKRAQRHLRALATLYGWSPEYLAEAEKRFLQQSYLTPIMHVSPYPPLPDEDEDEDEDEDDSE
jgi:hypothetical protein